MDKKSHSKVILITGTSSGFGLLTAARLASQGHHVIATMRDVTKKDALLKEVEKRKARVKILPLDVTDQNSIHQTVLEIIKQYGQIDVVVNNAGYGIGGFFEDLTAEEIRSQMETNFFGCQNLIREVVPFMREKKRGKIINISSIAGLYALPGFGAYNASKWAVEGFSESLYYELKPFGINVCLIEPGSYKTEIFYKNRKYAQNYDNPQSPYYKYSRYFKKKVDEMIDADKKNPEDIAILVEKLTDSKNPPFRNIPDLSSKILITLRKYLPFRIFSGILYRLSMGNVKA